MRALALCVALLSADPVLAGSYTTVRTAGSRTFPNNGGAGIVFSEDFATTGCIASPVADSGQAITVTRASTKRCGSSLTTCQNNELCVESDGALIEDQAVNSALQSQAFDNAAWTKTNVTAPTADTQVAPDGTTTAELLATSSSGGLVDSTAITVVASVYAVSVYAKTTAGTQSFDLRIRNDTAGSDACTANNQTATTTWTRFSCVMGAAATNGHSLRLRIYPGTSGGTGTIVAWGAQFEAVRVTSYIATTGTGTTRPADAVSVSVSAMPGLTLVGSDFSIATDFRLRVLGNYIAIGSNANFLPLLRVSTGSGNLIEMFANSAGSTATATLNDALKTSQTNRVGGYVSGSQFFATVDGVAGSAQTLGAQPSAPTVIYLGNHGSGNYINGWLKNVCIGRKAGSCR